MTLWRKIKDAGAVLLGSAAAVGAIIGSLVTFIFSDYLQYTSLIRKDIASNYSELTKTANQLEQQINTLMTKAAGEPGNFNEVKKAINRDILSLHQTARILKTEIPALEVDFANYSKALIELRRASESIVWPIRC